MKEITRHLPGEIVLPAVFYCRFLLQDHCFLFFIYPGKAFSPVSREFPIKTALDFEKRKI